MEFDGSENQYLDALHFMYFQNSENLEIGRLVSRKQEHQRLNIRLYTMNMIESCLPYRMAWP